MNKPNLMETEQQNIIVLLMKNNTMQPKLNVKSEWGL